MGYALLNNVLNPKNWNNEDNKKWKAISLSICGDKDLANDILQEAYIKIFEKEEVNSRYIYRTILNLFINYCKETKNIRLTEKIQIECNQRYFEPTDEEEKILKRIDSLQWHQKELLSESCDRSLRQIESEYNINYGFVFREIKQAKEFILNG